MYDVLIVIADLQVISPALPTIFPPPSKRLMLWDAALIPRSADPLRLLMFTKATTVSFPTQRATRKFIVLACASRIRKAVFTPFAQNLFF